MAGNLSRKGMLQLDELRIILGRQMKAGVNTFQFNISISTFVMLFLHGNGKATLGGTEAPRY